MPFLLQPPNRYALFMSLLAVERRRQNDTLPLRPRLNPTNAFMAAKVTHLAVTVHHVVDVLRVPLITEAEQLGRHETVLGHDDEVGEEAGAGLDAADDAVRQGEEPVVDQFFRERVPGRPPHDVEL